MAMQADLKTYKDKIYPRVFLIDELKLVLEDEADFPIHRLWLKDLALGYVIDRGDKFTFISKCHLGYEMTAEEMMELAMNNFVRDFEFKIVQTIFGCYELEGEPDHCATAIFVAPIWEKVAAHFGKDLVVAFPSYDLVFMTAADDAEGISNLKMELYKIQGMGIEKRLREYLFLFKSEEKAWSFLEDMEEEELF